MPSAIVRKPCPSEVGRDQLVEMLNTTQSHWLSGFLASDFSRVSTKAAEDACQRAGLSSRMRTKDILSSDDEVDNLHEALGTVAENKGRTWTDAELTSVLSTPPTKANAAMHSAAFKRNAGSVEIIYRWATTPEHIIRAKRGSDAHVMRILKLRKQLGWLA